MVRQVPTSDELAAAVRRGERRPWPARSTCWMTGAPLAAACGHFLADLQRRHGLKAALDRCDRPTRRGQILADRGPDHRVAARGLSVGVLAVDPSSPISGGALLGDRLRMKTSSDDDGVFVRSLACRGEFGGLSAEVWPMSLVMLAAFDIALIETVGVGQREIDVSRMCDTTCYVAQPGSGDSVQFLKAGILEVPHILVVNKEDMGAVARRTLSELGAALSREHSDGDWQVPVLSASATTGTGIEALADAMEQHHQLCSAHDVLAPPPALPGAVDTETPGEEFGSFGCSALGGEQDISLQLQAQDTGLFEQYEVLRSKLLTVSIITNRLNNLRR